MDLGEQALRTALRPCERRVFQYSTGARGYCAVLLVSLCGHRTTSDLRSKCAAYLTLALASE